MFDVTQQLTRELWFCFSANARNRFEPSFGCLLAMALVLIRHHNSYEPDAGAKIMLSSLLLLAIASTP